MHCIKKFEGYTKENTKSSEIIQIFIDRFILEIADKWLLKEYEHDITKYGTMQIHRYPSVRAGQTVYDTIFSENGYFIKKNSEILYCKIFLEVSDSSRYDSNKLLNIEYPGLHADLDEYISKMDKLSEKFGYPIYWRNYSKSIGTATPLESGQHDLHLISLNFHFNLTDKSW